MTGTPHTPTYTGWRAVPLALTLFAGLATIAAFAGDLWWVLDLLAHFRVQYLVLLVALALVALALRQRLAGAIAGALALVDLAALAPSCPGAAADGPAALTILSANVNSANADYERLLDTIPGSAAPPPAPPLPTAPRPRPRHPRRASVDVHAFVYRVSCPDTEAAVSEGVSVDARGLRRAGALEGAGAGAGGA